MQINDNNNQKKVVKNEIYNFYNFINLKRATRVY